MDGSCWGLTGRRSWQQFKLLPPARLISLYGGTPWSCTYIHRSVTSWRSLTVRSGLVMVSCMLQLSSKYLNMLGHYQNVLRAPVFQVNVNICFWWVLEWMMVPYPHKWFGSRTPSGWSWRRPNLEFLSGRFLLALKGFYPDFLETSSDRQFFYPDRGSGRSNYWKLEWAGKCPNSHQKCICSGFHWLRA